MRPCDYDPSEMSKERSEGGGGHKCDRWPTLRQARGPSTHQRTASRKVLQPVQTGGGLLATCHAGVKRNSRQMRVCLHRVQRPGANYGGPLADFNRLDNAGQDIRVLGCKCFDHAAVRGFENKH